MDFKKNQIFVRNLAFETTSNDLLELFQDIGPVKRASVAVENGVPKGYGFVKFALEEDANRAIETLNGTLVKGRKIDLEIAVKKGQNPTKSSVEAVEVPTKKTVTATRNENVPKKAIPSALNVVVQPNAAGKSMFLLVFGMPNDTKKKSFLKIVKKLVRKAECDTIREDHPLFEAVSALSPPGKTFIVTVPSRKHSAKLIQALDGQPVRRVAQHALANGDTRASTVAENADSGEVGGDIPFPLAGEDSGGAAAVSSGGGAVAIDAALSGVKRGAKVVIRSLAEVTEPLWRRRKCRVIVRNLSFQANEENVIDKLGKFGPLVEVSIPKIEVEVKTPLPTSTKGTKRGRESKAISGGSQGGTEVSEVTSAPKLRPRGFAFVTFLCERDAQAAVKDGAGLRVCNREVAVDFCSSKDMYTKYGMESAEGAQEEDGSVSAMGGEDGVDGPIASPIGDFHEANSSKGLGKGKKGASSNGDEDDEGSDDGDDDVDSDSDGDDGDGDDGVKGEEVQVDADEVEAKYFQSEVLATDDATDAEDDDHIDEDEDDEAEGEREDERGPEVDLNDAHQGCTVFLRDLAYDATPVDLRDALKGFGIITWAALVKDKATGLSRGSAFVKFSDPSEALACVSAVNARDQAQDGGPASVLMIKGRPLRADVAVDRDMAGRLKSERERRKHGLAKDRRNMYLANEGLVLDDKKNSTGMSDNDREKRKGAQTEKRKKLTNPIFFVSAHRVSFRNLPKVVTDHDLKILCAKALKSALSKEVVTPVDCEAQFTAQGLPFDRSKGDLDIPGHSNSAIKSAKVILDLERMKNGVPQSRGFGFVEFVHHAHALACLRELNNNPHYTRYLPPLVLHELQQPHNREDTISTARLIVEFSLENMNKVKLLREREERVTRRREEAANGKAKGGASMSPKQQKRAAKRQRQQAAKRVSKGQGDVEDAVGAVVSEDALAGDGEEGSATTSDQGREAKSKKRPVSGTADVDRAITITSKSSSSSKKRRKGDDAESGGRGEDAGGDGDDDDDDRPAKVAKGSPAPAVSDDEAKRASKAKRRRADQKRREKVKKRAESKKVVKGTAPTDSSAKSSTKGDGKSGSGKKQQHSGKGNQAAVRPTSSKDAKEGRAKGQHLQDKKGVAKGKQTGEAKAQRKGKANKGSDN